MLPWYFAMINSTMPDSYYSQMQQLSSDYPDSQVDMPINRQI